MPEAAMDEDRRTSGSQYDIRAPGQIAAMQSEPEAPGMQKPTDVQFGRRILVADTTHHLGPLPRAVGRSLAGQARPTTDRLGTSM